MIDISMIKCGDKCYSTKSILSGVGTDNVTCKILNVDLVDPVGATSFKKLKNVFSSEENQGEMLSTKKYSFIYSSLGEKLIQKYHMKHLAF